MFPAKNRFRVVRRMFILGMPNERIEYFLHLQPASYMKRISSLYQNVQMLLVCSRCNPLCSIKSWITHFIQHDCLEYISNLRFYFSCVYTRFMQRDDINIFPTSPCLSSPFYTSHKRHVNYAQANNNVFYPPPKPSHQAANSALTHFSNPPLAIISCTLGGRDPTL